MQFIDSIRAIRRLVCACVAAPYGPVRFGSNWPSYSRASPPRGEAKQSRFPTQIVVTCAVGIP